MPILPLIVAIVGVLIYALTDKKLMRIGEILFFVGSFIAVWVEQGVHP